MFSKLFRCWRVVATGSAFALFGIGGLLAAVVFPMMNRLPGSRFIREARVQRVVHWLFRRFVQYMRAVGILHVEVVDAHLLQSPGGQLLVANHPTLLDVVMLGALVPQLDCVVKRASWSNPFMRGPIVAAGYIPNDPGEALVDQCAERLPQGDDRKLAKQRPQVGRRSAVAKRDRDGVEAKQQQSQLARLEPRIAEIDSQRIGEIERSLQDPRDDAPDPNARVIWR